MDDNLIDIQKAFVDHLIKVSTLPYNKYADIINDIYVSDGFMYLRCINKHLINFLSENYPDSYKTLMYKKNIIKNNLDVDNTPNKHIKRTGIGVWKCSKIKLDDTQINNITPFEKLM